jgi:hypothetical protein
LSGDVAVPASLIAKRGENAGPVLEGPPPLPIPTGFGRTGLVVPL